MEITKKTKNCVIYMRFNKDHYFDEIVTRDQIEKLKDYMVRNGFVVHPDLSVYESQE